MPRHRAHRVHQLQHKWAGLSWLQRYMHSSFELNMRLCGLGATIHQSHNIWTPARIKACMQWMRKHAHVTKSQVAFYRGTSHASVMMEKDPDSLASPKRNKCIMSLTSKRTIAKEFAWPREMGIVHRLCLAPGCKVLDMQYNGLGVKREKETLLLPGHTSVLLSRTTRGCSWQVSA